jgi:hypothetical protein
MKFDCLKRTEARVRVVSLCSYLNYNQYIVTQQGCTQRNIARFGQELTSTANLAAKIRNDGINDTIRNQI